MVTPRRTEERSRIGVPTRQGPVSPLTGRPRFDNADYSIQMGDLAVLNQRLRAMAARVGPRTTSRLIGNELRRAFREGAPRRSGALRDSIDISVTRGRATIDMAAHGAYQDIGFVHWISGKLIVKHRGWVQRVLNVARENLKQQIRDAARSAGVYRAR